MDSARYRMDDKEFGVELIILHKKYLKSGYDKNQPAAELLMLTYRKLPINGKQRH